MVVVMTESRVGRHLGVQTCGTPDGAVDQPSHFTMYNRRDDG
jgi:hypothetical protein